MESTSQPDFTASASTTAAASAPTEAKQPLSSAVETAKARAGNLQAQLADALDSGAGVIRQRAASLASAPPADIAPGTAANVLERVTPQVVAQGELAATAMERGATWLRANDFSDIEERVVGQLKQNPVRTLGIAAILGFLVAGRRR